MFKNLVWTDIVDMMSAMSVHRHEAGLDNTHYRTGANSHVTLQATLIFCAETNKQTNSTKANDGFLLDTI